MVTNMWVICIKSSTVSPTSDIYATDFNSWLWIFLYRSCFLLDSQNYESIELILVTSHFFYRNLGTILMTDWNGLELNDVCRMKSNRNGGLSLCVRIELSGFQTALITRNLTQPPPPPLSQTAHLGGRLCILALPLPNPWPLTSPCALFTFCHPLHLWVLWESRGVLQCIKR